MRKVGRDRFIVDKDSPVWYQIDALRSIPGIKPRVDRGKLVELILHRSHLPLLRGTLGRDPSYLIPTEGASPLESPYPLRDYQREAIEFSRGLRGVLFAHDLGLGKSAIGLQSLELPALLICPTSALYVWGKECEAHGLDYQILQGLSASVDQIDHSAKVWITTYGSLGAWIGYFRKSSVGPSIQGMLVDEAHALHHRTSRWSKLVKGIAKEQTILLTATPTRNRLVTLHGLLDVIGPGAWGTRYDYRQRYCGSMEGDYGLVDGEPTNVEELAARVGAVACWESWTSPRVQHLRPKLVVETISLEMDRSELYDIARQALARAYQDKVVQSSPLPLQTAQKVLAGEAKVDWLQTHNEGLDVLDRILATHSRIIFWCWHKDVAKKLHAHPWGRPVDIVTGDDLTHKRGLILGEWQNGSGPRILVATMGALSTAVNLTTADAAVFVELSWAPIDIQQAEARHHRPGNKNATVYSYYLVVPNTIEDRIAEVLVEKLEHHEEIFGASSQHDQITALKGDR